MKKGKREKMSYDRNLINVNSHKLMEFIKSPLTGNLLNVPCIGVATFSRLKTVNIDNTYALIGKFLTLITEEDTNHCDRFVNFLCHIGISYKLSINITYVVLSVITTLMPHLEEAH
jgi:hypothetical protein